MKQSALQGIRVVELATVVAAPTTARLLSDFGAEVIKIEVPDGGDLLRPTGEGIRMPIEDGNNPAFDLFNSGKQLTSINLKSEEGMKILLQLLETADVFISNTRMRSLEKMGLDYETLHQRFPRLIYAHFSGFGPQGPDAGRPGYDASAFWMRTGAVFDWVQPGNFPVRPSFAFGDIASASYFLNGILIALLGRERTGMGTKVETSLFASGIWHNGPFVLATQPPYSMPLPFTRHEPWEPVGDVYQCADGEWVAPFKKVFAKDRYIFAKLLDMPELAEDDDYLSPATLRKAGKIEHCSRRIAQAIAGKTADEWAALFTQYDIPFERSHHISQIHADPQAIANGYVKTVEYPDGATPAVPQPPIALSEYDRRPFCPTQGIGADTGRVLQELGYSEEEIARLRETGAVR